MSGAGENRAPAWQAPQVGVGYGADITGRGGLDSQIARQVSQALREARKDERSRGDVAKAMSDYLGRDVSEAMLNKWSAEASNQHRIPLDAFIALIEATGANDLAGFVPRLFGFTAVPERYAAIIELHLIDEHEKALAARRAALKAQLANG